MERVEFAAKFDNAVNGIGTGGTLTPGDVVAAIVRLGNEVYGLNPDKHPAEILAGTAGWVPWQTSGVANEAFAKGWHPLSANPPPANLATLTTACPAAATGEIIVCGARQVDRYRLPPLAPADTPRLGPAEFGIAGARIGVATEQGSIGPIPTNRVMAHIRIRF